MVLNHFFKPVTGQEKQMRFTLAGYNALELYLFPFTLILAFVRNTLVFPDKTYPDSAAGSESLLFLS